MSKLYFGFRYSGPEMDPKNYLRTRKIFKYPKIQKILPKIQKIPKPEPKTKKSVILKIYGNTQIYIIYTKSFEYFGYLIGSRVGPGPNHVLFGRSGSDFRVHLVRS